MCVLYPEIKATFFSPSSIDLIEYRIDTGLGERHDDQLFGGADRTLSQLRAVEDPVLHHLSRAMANLLHAQQLTSHEPEDAFARAVVSRLIDRHRPNDSDGPAGCSGGLPPKHIRKVRKRLSGDLREGVSVVQLASECGLSVGHFARAFRQTFGESVHRHVLMLRIERAKHLLQASSLSLREVAHEVGYADQATFTESFGKVSGITPGRYRRQFAIHWQ